MAPYPEWTLEESRAGTGISPHLKWNVATVHAKTHRRRNSVKSEPAQVIDEIRLSVGLLLGAICFNNRVSRMAVGIDDGGHHGLSSEIHMNRSGWGLQLSPFPHSADAAILHKERGVFDWSAVIAGNQPRALEHNRASGILRGGLLQCIR